VRSISAMVATVGTDKRSVKARTCGLCGLCGTLTYDVNAPHHHLPTAGTSWPVMWRLWGPPTWTHAALVQGPCGTEGPYMHTHGAISTSTLRLHAEHPAVTASSLCCAAVQRSKASGYCQAAALPCCAPLGTQQPHSARRPLCEGLIGWTTDAG
jgi:hypothetical protein